MPSRFAEVNEHEIKLLSSSSGNQSKKKIMARWIRVIQKWAPEHRYEQQHEMYLHEELDRKLTQFYGEVRKNHSLKKFCSPR